MLLTAPTSEMKSPKNGIASAKITENIKNSVYRCEIWRYEKYTELNKIINLFCQQKSGKNFVVCVFALWLVINMRNEKVMKKGSHYFLVLVRTLQQLLLYEDERCLIGTKAELTLHFSLQHAGVGFYVIICNQFPVNKN